MHTYLLKELQQSKAMEQQRPQITDKKKQHLKILQHLLNASAKLTIRK